jgi:uncharacterized paraquat-inducible protein A
MTRSIILICIRKRYQTYLESVLKAIRHIKRAVMCMLNNLFLLKIHKLRLEGNLSQINPYLMRVKQFHLLKMKAWIYNSLKEKLYINFSKKNSHWIKHTESSKPT